MSLFPRVLRSNASDRPAFLRRLNRMTAIGSLLQTIPLIYLGWYELVFIYLLFATLHFGLSRIYAAQYEFSIRYISILSMVASIVICSLLPDRDIEIEFFLIPVSITIFHLFDRDEWIHRLILLNYTMDSFVYLNLVGPGIVPGWIMFTCTDQEAVLYGHLNIIFAVISTLFSVYEINIYRDNTIDNIKKNLDFRTSLNNLLAHDLRVPISNIQQLSNLIQPDLSEDEKVDLINMIQISSDKTLHIINDLLYLSKLEITDTIRKEKVDLIAFTEDVVKQLQNQIQSKKLDIQVRSKNNQVKADIEPAMFKRVLDNLIYNAIKYSYENGRIIIDINSNIKSGEIRIVDMGIGMSKEQLENLFIPFSGSATKGTSGEGSTGLGLSIVKYILDLHGFTIQTESEPSKGTTFIIQFYF